MQPIRYDLVTIDSLSLPGVEGSLADVAVLRLDKIHPVVSGNKIFKLKEYLATALTAGKKEIITFGGAWSNHIVATAAVCKSYGLSCTGYIRGEAPARWSSTLLEAQAYGMQLKFIDRETYRQQKRNIQTDHPETCVIPEGGFGIAGMQGASSIPGHFQGIPFTHICCAAGTGTMAAGLAVGVGNGEQIIAVSALKNNLQLAADIRSLTGESVVPPVLIHDYHFGGFAKYDTGLIRFMNDMYTATGIPTDFVYTAKLFYAIRDLIIKNHFPTGSRILLIHSGGLQGNSSLGKGTLIF
ncbi:MAG: pyridoxal-phosphate dependent enzyme [Bacteroidetes bacterium]|nr:pyridoxal-phosphate dependent enzyme [Bacteroidota bacterium]